MRTLYTVLLGIIILLFLRFMGQILHRHSGKKAMSYTFILLWFIATCWNMYNGMQQGYSALEESGFLLINFGVPALLACYLIYKDMRSK